MYKLREKYKYLIPHPKKGLGQHFLRDHKVARDIALFVWQNNPKFVLEIGPGAGDLTFALLEMGPVIAIEIDGRLKPFWDAVQREIHHLQVIWADFLQIGEETLPVEPYNVAGNLPYMVGTAIISHLLKSFKQWNRGAFMLQKQVAKRIYATSGKSKSSLSIWFQTYAEVISTQTVKPGAFFPPPKVMSEVIYTRRREEPLCEADPDKWEMFLKGVFKQKRKTLKNNLISMGYSKECVEYILRNLGIMDTIRGEEVNVETLCHVYHMLSSKDICKDQSNA